MPPRKPKPKPRPSRPRKPSCTPHLVAHSLLSRPDDPKKLRHALATLRSRAKLPPSAAYTCWHTVAFPTPDLRPGEELRAAPEAAAWRLTHAIVAPGGLASPGSGSSPVSPVDEADTAPDPLVLSAALVDVLLTDDEFDALDALYPLVPGVDVTAATADGPHAYEVRGERTTNYLLDLVARSLATAAAHSCVLFVSNGERHVRVSGLRGYAFVFGDGADQTPGPMFDRSIGWRAGGEVVRPGAHVKLFTALLDAAVEVVNQGAEVE
ncbi:uncharacterized protein LOC62_03G005121 [Vanrija pseudolonga]|uniref:Uncharacterized protein n=1 Tax=Vanrija pseudolonga TaxID=143232 RepID=A0AAF1BM32_9TREE|nr:hypothetical protein LOC62_03G005121 [Vanrija pseudolonga]